MAKTRKMSNKKKAAVTVAAVLIIALLTGGAFAWKDFSQSYTNRFRGSGDNDVILHDDFEPGVKKDVYVENGGDAPVIVRVRLDEYFEVAGVTLWGEDSTSQDKASWIAHLYDQDDDFTVCDCPAHKYFDWEMLGSDKIYSPGTNPIGKWDYSNDADTVSTLPTNAPVTMAYYAELKAKAAANTLTAAEKTEWDRINTGCWVLDDDGWAYWSILLKKGEATNLLLSNVTLKDGGVLDDNYYYAINVILQACNRAEAYEILDLAENEGKPTFDAEQLIKDLTDTGSTTNAPVSFALKAGTYTTSIPEGQTFLATNPNFTIVVTYADGSKKELKSGFSVSPSGALTSDGTLTVTYKDCAPQTVNYTVIPTVETSLFKSPYDVTPTYKPAVTAGSENYDLNRSRRINFYEVGGTFTQTYEYNSLRSTAMGVELATILDSAYNAGNITITKVEVPSRGVTLTTGMDQYAYINGGTLCVKFLPTYAELCSANDPINNPVFDALWDVEIPVQITLKDTVSGKTGVFTIVAMFAGVAELQNF